MKILITGATGFIGSRLILRLFQEGHDLVILTRDAKKATQSVNLPCQIIECDLTKNIPSVETLSGVNAVIHLAGESVATSRWTQAKKQKIIESRTVTTSNLINGFKQAGVKPPEVFLSTSAIGYYGDRNDEQLTENSVPGEGFLADICQEWEDQARLAACEQSRIVILRLGVVLGRGGGALEKMATAFSLGLGARLGNSKQWMSWVHIDDVVEAFCFALGNNKVNGPLNVVSEYPVTNDEFTRTLASAFGKKAYFTLPSTFLKVMLGEMSAVFLRSTRALPVKLKSLDFNFAYPKLEQALREIYSENPNQVFEAYQFVARDLNKVFEFFSEAKNLETLTPPLLNFKIIAQTSKEIQEGTEIDYRLKIHGLPTRWKTRIQKWVVNECFVDEQLKGPYSRWYHTHSFERLRGGTLMRDHVSYRLPLGQLGQLVAGWFVRGDVKKIFAFRKEKILELFGSK